jgi:hypothetical protein
LHGTEYQQLKKHGTLPSASCSVHGMQSNKLWQVFVQSHGPQMPHVSRHGASVTQPGIDMMSGKHGMNWQMLRQSMHEQSILSVRSDCGPLGFRLFIEAASRRWSQQEGSQIWPHNWQHTHCEQHSRGVAGPSFSDG